MEIVAALQLEQSKLEKQLIAVQAAISALTGGAKTGRSTWKTSEPKNVAVSKRTMSAAVKAKISKKAKERWAKIRAAKAKQTK